MIIKYYIIGGLADDHDVLHILTTSLHPPSQASSNMKKVSSEEEIKLSQEYQKYQNKLEQRKEEYHRYKPFMKSF
jgi:mannose-binding lectin 1